MLRISVLLATILTAGYLLRWEYRIVSELRPLRIDLEPDQSAFEGRSMWVQVNVVRSENYDPSAKPLLRKLVAVAVVRVVAQCAAFVALFPVFALLVAYLQS